MEMKILGIEFFKPKTPESTAPPTPASPAVEAQQRVDAMQGSLNTLRQNQDMVKEPGVPSVDAPQIADVSAKIEASGITPTVPPVESKAQFATPSAPGVLNRVSQGLTPEPALTANMTNEQLTAEVNKIPTPIGVTRETIPTSVPHTPTPVTSETGKPPVATPIAEKKAA